MEQSVEVGHLPSILQPALDNAIPDAGVRAARRVPTMGLAAKSEEPERVYDLRVLGDLEGDQEKPAAERLHGHNGGLQDPGARRGHHSTKRRLNILKISIMNSQMLCEIRRVETSETFRFILKEEKAFFLVFTAEWYERFANYSGARPARLWCSYSRMSSNPSGER